MIFLGKRGEIAVLVHPQPQLVPNQILGDRLAHSKQPKVILLSSGLNKGQASSTVTAKAASGFTENKRVTIMHD